MKAPAFLEFICEINQLDYHQRTVLAKTLNQLEDDPKVYDLIETIFDSDGCVRTALTLKTIDTE